MKSVLSVLLCGTLSFSTFSYANDIEVIETEKEVTPEVKIETIATETHTPLSCSLLDKALCMLDLQNVQIVHDIIHILSKKKGETIVFTTENVEDILAKMRELNITNEDLEKLKTDPKLCVEKLRPVLELTAKYAQIELNEALINQFCEQASAAVSTASSLYQIYEFAHGNFNQSMKIAMIFGMMGAGYLKGGIRVASGVTVVALIAYMLSTPLPLITP